MFLDRIDDKTHVDDLIEISDQIEQTNEQCQHF